jgi:hypothetical protein
MGFIGALKKQCSYSVDYYMPISPLFGTRPLLLSVPSLIFRALPKSNHVYERKINKSHVHMRICISLLCNDFFYICVCSSPLADFERWQTAGRWRSGTKIIKAVAASSRKCVTSRLFLWEIAMFSRLTPPRELCTVRMAGVLADTFFFSVLLDKTSFYIPIA